MEGYLKIKGVNYSYTQHGHVFKYVKVNEVWHKRTDTVWFHLYKISASANLFMVTESRCILVGGSAAKENLDNEYPHYPDCYPDGFMGVNIRQNSSNCTLKICGVCCMLM